MSKLFQQKEDQEISQVLRETWHSAEEVTEKGIYRKLKFRKVERIGFYIRPLREWWFPCPKCQQDLKKMLANGNWILGNKEYEPAIELNSSTEDEIDEASWQTLEEHKATPEEVKRIGIGGWENIE